MRTTATINSYAKRADDLVDVTLLENRNYQEYQDSSYVFIKNHDQRLWFENSTLRSGITGDTIIGVGNIYTKSDSILGVGTNRVVDMRSDKTLAFVGNSTSDTAITVVSRFGLGSVHTDKIGGGHYSIDNYNTEDYGASIRSDSIIVFAGNIGAVFNLGIHQVTEDFRLLLAVLDSLYFHGKTTKYLRAIRAWFLHLMDRVVQVDRY